MPQVRPPYPRLTHRIFLDRLRPVLSPDEFKHVRWAYEFSKSGHRNQARDDGRRFFDHPRAVAWILINELGCLNAEMIIAALLHDIVEDSFIMDEESIEDIFGTRVVKMVKLLTKKPKKGYFERLVQYGWWEVWVLKLADRLHNLRDLKHCSVEKQQRYLQETAKEFMPVRQALFDATKHKDDENKEFFRNLTYWIDSEVGVIEERLKRKK